MINNYHESFIYNLKRWVISLDDENEWITRDDLISEEKEDTWGKKLDNLDQSIFKVFDFLTLKELSSVAATSKKMYSLVHDELYSRSLFIPKLEERVIRNNALVLYNYPNGNFYVAKDRSLILVNEYNLYGRCYNWLHSSDSQAQVREVVKITLCEIYRLNVRGLPYSVEPQIYPTQVYVWDFKDEKIPYLYVMKADRVCYRILKSEQFNTLSINQAANRLLNQLKVPRKTNFCNMYFKIGKHIRVTN